MTIAAIGSELVRWMGLVFSYAQSPFGRSLWLLFGMAAVGAVAISVRRLITGRKP